MSDTGFVGMLRRREGAAGRYKYFGYVHVFRLGSVVCQVSGGALGGRFFRRIFVHAVVYCVAIV